MEWDKLLENRSSSCPDLQAAWPYSQSQALYFAAVLFIGPIIFQPVKRLPYQTFSRGWVLKSGTKISQRHIALH